MNALRIGAWALLCALVACGGGGGGGGGGSSPASPPPATTSGPSKKRRTSSTKAKGLMVPVWPPAPQQTRISPSAPAAAALRASAGEFTSAKTSPP